MASNTRKRSRTGSKVSSKSRGKRYKANRGWSKYDKHGYQVVSVPKLGGIPDRFLTKICYDREAYGTLDSSTAVTHQFRLNSVYDFDYSNTMGDKQAVGHDRLAASYSRYFVKYVTLVVKVMVSGFNTEFSGTTATSNATGVTVRFGRWLSEDATTSPSVPTHWQGMPGYRQDFVAQNNSGTYVFKIPVQKLVGEPDDDARVTGFGATSGSNPAKTIWGQLQIQSPNATSAVTTNYALSFRAYQTVEYTRPKQGPLDTA